MAGNTESRTIVINPQTSLYTRSFEEGERIYQKEFETLKNAIESKLRNSAHQKHESQGFGNKFKRTNDAYTVLGSRGSGKSSFLYSIASWCESNHKSDIEMLDMIDPTLYDDKGHILLSVISQIVSRVDKKLSSSAISVGLAYDRHTWENCYKKLARGIPAIDKGNFIKDNWMDPDFVMNQGMEDVQSSIKLEENLNEMFSYALTILDKKLFVIEFDDVDIDFRKGWEVLETVRKYLTSPQVFVIMSGDLNLFSKSIRKIQWKNFGKALLLNENSNLQKAGFNALVNDMESQYMQKVMPSQNRIYFRTLLDIVNTGTPKITVGNIATQEKQELSELSKYYYSKLLSAYNAPNNTQLKVFVDYILSLPLRTQMQLIHAYDENGGVRDIVMPLANSIISQGININEIISFPHRLNAVILKFLTENQIIDENYQLQPNTLISNLNATLYALSEISVSLYKNNAYLIFDYFIRIGYIRFLKHSHFTYSNSKTKSFNLYDIDNLYKHAQLYNHIELKVCVGNIIAYLDGLGIKSGEIIGLWGLESTAKSGDLIGRIDNVFKGNNNAFNKILAYLPLTFSKHTDMQSSNTRYSIVTLLAAIADIVREALEQGPGKQKAKIIEFLNSLSQIRYYVIPKDTTEITGTTVTPTAVNDGNASDIAEENDKISGFADKILEWINKAPQTAVPPYLLGKIATRAISAMSDLTLSNDKKLGEEMNTRIRIFLNAVLVEEARELLTEITLNNNTPSGDSKIFVDNLNKIDDLSKLPLTDWMLQCPLLTTYINTGEFDNLNNKSWIENISNNIFDKLSNVSINPASSVTVKKPKFYVNWRDLKYTTNIIKQKYPTPESLFASKSDVDVKNELQKIFEHVMLRQVRSLRAKKGSKTTW